MKHPLDIVTVLFDTDKKPGTAGSAGWGLYDPTWVDKLYRGFARNLQCNFNFHCITTYQWDDFEQDIKVHPFEYEPHVGSWMCINEIFRPDLELNHCLFTGLDTIICQDITLLAGYRGPMAMTKNMAASTPRFSNAMVLFDGKNPLCEDLWLDYIAGPKFYSNRSTADWSHGEPSEYLYWNNFYRGPIGCINSLYNELDIVEYQHWKMTAQKKLPHVCYFRGSSKPSNCEDEKLLAHWK